mmetsp:Transcript_22614/g.63506  ORF Transcript_22614/g.63506 Transcript_22614/m.63506 type:complete len:735 (+) Transcript_22614:120-2324(+)
MGNLGREWRLCRISYKWFEYYIVIFILILVGGQLCGGKVWEGSHGKDGDDLRDRLMRDGYVGPVHTTLMKDFDIPAMIEEMARGDHRIRKMGVRPTGAGLATRLPEDSVPLHRFQSILHAVSPECRQVVQHPDVVRAARAALGTDFIMLTGGKYVAKEGGQNHRWHSDADAYRLGDDGLVMWIPLENVGQDSYFSILPHSQSITETLSGQLRAMLIATGDVERTAVEIAEDNRRVETMFREDTDFAARHGTKVQAVRLTNMVPGDLVMVHARTWHATQNDTPRRRAALVLTFARAARRRFLMPSSLFQPMAPNVSAHLRPVMVLGELPADWMGTIINKYQTPDTPRECVLAGVGTLNVFLPDQPCETIVWEGKRKTMRVQLSVSQTERAVSGPDGKTLARTLSLHGAVEREGVEMTKTEKGEGEKGAARDVGHGLVESEGDEKLRAQTTNTRFSTDILEYAEIHYSRIRPGYYPHPLHSHFNEEIIMVVGGIGKIRRTYGFGPPDMVPKQPAATRLETDTTSWAPEEVMLLPGDFIYYPSFSNHTLSSVSPEQLLGLRVGGHPPVMDDLEDAATFLCIRFQGRRDWREFPGRRPLFAQRVERPFFDDTGKRFRSPHLLDGSTRTLGGLRAHTSSLLPRESTYRHTDTDHDILMVILEGSLIVNTGSNRREHRGAREYVYIPTGIEHSFFNDGNTTAEYYSIEFFAPNKEEKKLGKKKRTKLKKGDFARHFKEKQ